MAAEIEKAFSVKPKLTQGDRGIFDVLVDGQPVYSKYQTGRFPKDGELTGILKARS